MAGCKKHFLFPFHISIWAFRNPAKINVQTPFIFQSAICQVWIDSTKSGNNQRVSNSVFKVTRNIDIESAWMDFGCVIWITTYAGSKSLKILARFSEAPFLSLISMSAIRGNLWTDSGLTWTVALFSTIRGCTLSRKSVGYFPFTGFTLASLYLSRVTRSN